MNNILGKMTNMSFGTLGLIIVVGLVLMVVTNLLVGKTMSAKEKEPFMWSKFVFIHELIHQQVARKLGLYAGKIETGDEISLDKDRYAGAVYLAPMDSEHYHMMKSEKGQTVHTEPKLYTTVFTLFHLWLASVAPLLVGTGLFFLAFMVISPIFGSNILSIIGIPLILFISYFLGQFATLSDTDLKIHDFRVGVSVLIILGSLFASNFLFVEMLYSYPEFLGYLTPVYLIALALYCFLSRVRAGWFLLIPAILVIPYTALYLRPIIAFIALFTIGVSISNLIRWLILVLTPVRQEEPEVTE